MGLLWRPKMGSLAKAANITPRCIVENIVGHEGTFPPTAVITRRRIDGAEGDFTSCCVFGQMDGLHPTLFSIFQWPHHSIFFFTSENCLIMPGSQLTVGLPQLSINPKGWGRAFTFISKLRFLITQFMQRCSCRGYLRELGQRRKRTDN